MQNYRMLFNKISVIIFLFFFFSFVSHTYAGWGFTGDSSFDAGDATSDAGVGLGDAGSVTVDGADATSDASTDTTDSSDSGDSVSPGSEATVTVTPATIDYNTSTIVAWTTVNIPGGVTCSNNWNSFLTITPNTSGSETRTMTNSFTFTVACSNGSSGSALLTVNPPPATAPNVFSNATCIGNTPVTDVWWGIPSGWNSDNITITRSDGGVDGGVGNIPSWTLWRDWTANGNNTQYGYNVYFHSPTNGPDNSGRGFGPGWSAPGNTTVTTPNCAAPPPTPPPSAPPPAPIFTQAVGGCPNGSEDSYASLIWTPVNGATGYELIRDGTPSVSFGTNVYYSVYDNAVANSGGVALYYVRAYNSGGSSGWTSAFISIPDCLTPSAYSINTPISTCLGIGSPNLEVSITKSLHATKYDLYHARIRYDTNWVNPNPQSGSVNIPQFAQSYTFNDSTDLVNINPSTTVHYVVRAVNQNSGLYSDATSYFNSTKDCFAPQFDIRVNGSDIPNVTINYNTQANITFNNIHSSYCDRTSTVEGRSPSSDPNWNSRVLGNPSLVVSGSATTIRHTNPPTNTATYTIACTNSNLPPSIQTSTSQRIMTVNVKPEKPPFIETTGGDVHTQGRIIVPSASP